VSRLAAQQQALLHALFDWPAQESAQRLTGYATGVGTHPDRGLKAYQANGHMLAERALGAAYPVLVQMLGTESFAELARAFWHAHPPVRGDIAQWGGCLAEFVRNSPQLQDTPYLPDVALAEWALHRCATEQDRQAEPGSLALLTTDDPQTLTLVLTPGTTWVCSQWPLASIVLAHLEGTPSLAEVGAQLQRQMAQDVVIWRNGFQSRLRLALPGEAALLSTLQTGTALEPALDCASELDFPQWLPLAVQTGLVLGVRHISTNP
jgi:Putative DNA-binding domain